MFKRLMQRFMLLEGEGSGDAPAGGAPAAAPAAASADTAAASASAAPAAADLTPPGSLVADAKAPAPDAKPGGESGDTPQEGAESKDGKQPEASTEKQPIEYTAFTLPEGVEVDEQKMADFKANAAEAGLSQDQAQKLVDVYTAGLKSANEASTQLWYDQQKEWQQAVMKDPEIGGKNFEPMKETVAKAIDLIGGNEAAKIRQALEYTGAGNNPEIIRFLYRLGSAIGEGGGVDIGKPAAVETPRSAAERLYPSQSQPNQ